MKQEFSADVLIVGAGPVGLTLAMDLESRGVSVIVAERRHFKEPPSVKCNHVSARTMEQFRRLGVAGRLRDAGLPPDYPNDVAFRTSITGIELTRVPIPSRAERYTDTSGPDGWWPTPEPPHRINQIYLEPILLEHTDSLPGVRLFNCTEVIGFDQDDEGVTVRLKSLDSGEEWRARCQYLVGCDGGSSLVRKQIGATLSGTAVIQNVQSTFIRAPKLLEMIPGRSAWCFYSVNPRRCGTVFAIDGRETWLVHNHLNPNESSFDAVDRDTSIRNILGVGRDFDYEVLNKEDWVGRRLVADRFRDRRVFICGDASHLWVPYAGYGMNAGIADAINLSWHLSAHLRGWGDAAILDAYEIERQPITDQVSRFAMNHAQAMIAARGAVPNNIEVAGPEGEAVRANVGRAAYDLNVQQFCCAGLNFGYYYEDSPLIEYDGEEPPSYTMGSFTASTVPGCRAPHFWLADGSSLYDRFGPDYTLLRFHREATVEPLLAAARERGVPLQLLDIEGVAVPDAYRHRLVLCRADQHVAWRGDEIPQSPMSLVDKLRGYEAIRDVPRRVGNDSRQKI
ncbi:FAD-dependent oxidoreductase [Burkholderia sp. BCC0405]|uniref:FAD-dependent oxidoreductase n=1 Tax=Burkholderia sp. BCC0405 TaxID=2676298 RepID=UPI00158AFF1E|nr:FAD-dependent oxidoreductase [Burkholderia sp. BCC0405]